MEELFMLIVLRVDAGEFYKNIGDNVEKDEKIGMLRNTPVISDVNGVIQSIVLDEDRNELEIVINTIE
jgi:hypothetical protein